MDKKIIEQHIKAILKEIGEDPEREGLKDTPKRVAKMYEELFRGYDENQKPKVTTFNNGTDGLTYNQMAMDTGACYSQCEHHMIPFMGKYWFAYIPNKKGKLLGLSKVARIVNYYSARLQIQERLVKNIVDELWEALIIRVPNDVGDANNWKEVIEPIAMGLVMEAEHLCKTMRGVKKKGKMRTTELRGTLLSDDAARAEFLDWVNKNE